MTINNVADAISIELNQPHNHTLKEALKLDVRNLIAQRLRQTFEKNGIDPQYKLTYTDTLTLSNEQIGCVDIGCKILKGSNPVPLTIRYSSDNTYLFAGTIEGTPIKVGSETEYKLFKKSKYSKDALFILIRNGYPYVLGNTLLGYIRFDDIFQDVTQINTICDGCNNDDVDMRFPSDIFYEIQLEIVKKYKSIGTKDDTKVEPNKVGE